MGNPCYYINYITLYYENELLYVVGLALLRLNNVSISGIETKKNHWHPVKSVKAYAVEGYISIFQIVS